MNKKILVLLIINIIINISFGLYIISSTNTNNYDVNKDRKINSKDLLDLKKYLIKEDK